MVIVSSLMNFCEFVSVSYFLAITREIHTLHVVYVPCLLVGTLTKAQRFFVRFCRRGLSFKPHTEALCYNDIRTVE